MADDYDVSGYNSTADQSGGQSYDAQSMSGNNAVEIPEEDYADDSALIDKYFHGQLASQHLTATLPEDQQGQGQQGQQQDPQALIHKAALLKLAHEGEIAGDEVLRRHQAGEIDKANAWKADLIEQHRQEIQDQQVVDGLKAGKLIVSKADQQQIQMNDQYRSDIMANPTIPKDVKDELLAKINDRNTQIRRASTPVAPEQIGQMTAPMRKIAAFKQQNPILADVPITLNKDGSMMVPRGLKLNPPEDKEQRTFKGADGKLYTHDEWVAGAGPEQAKAQPPWAGGKGPDPLFQTTRIENQDQYDRLRPGAKYMRPDGKQTYKTPTQENINAWRMQQAIGYDTWKQLKANGTVMFFDPKTGKPEFHEPKPNPQQLQQEKEKDRVADYKMKQADRVAAAEEATKARQAAAAEADKNRRAAAEETRTQKGGLDSERHEETATRLWEEYGEPAAKERLKKDYAAVRSKYWVSSYPKGYEVPVDEFVAKNMPAEEVKYLSEHRARMADAERAGEESVQKEKQQTPSISSKEQYNQLQSGQEYIDSRDGKHKKKQ